MKASEALKVLDGGGPWLGIEYWEAVQEARVVLREKFEREEKPSTRCSVSIAGGLVHGDFERVKAVQALILENEQLRREAREREEKAKPKVTLKDQQEAVSNLSGAIRRELNDGVLEEDPDLRAAVETLRRMEEEGGELLAWLLSYHGINGPTTPGLKAVTLLRSLGVEPKP